MAPNWRMFMARTKTVLASAGSTKAPEATPEPGQAQQQGAATAPEADSPTGSVGGGQQADSATGDNSSAIADASISAEPGAGDSTDGNAQDQSSSPADADLQDAPLVTGSAVADSRASTSPNPLAIQIYPLRSYMDEGELRRRGGPAYTVPRRHAEDLVQRQLASLVPLKE